MVKFAVIDIIQRNHQNLVRKRCKNYWNLFHFVFSFVKSGNFWHFLCSQVPLTTYYFRVIAYNEFGISTPCASEETVREYEKATDDGDDGVDDDDGDHMRRPPIIWWWLKIVQMVIIELNSDKEKKEIGLK